MKAFDIFSWQPPGWPEAHPCVIVSHPDRAENKPDVEVVLCTSKTPTRGPLENEMILDSADGLDRPTLCKCDLIYAVHKTKLSNRRGSVSMPRRQHLIRKIIASHGWAEVLASAY